MMAATSMRSPATGTPDALGGVDRGAAPAPIPTTSSRRSPTRRITHASAAPARPAATASPSSIRAAGTARILAGLKLDAASVRAALLLGLPARKAFDADDVTARFGADVATLVAGVARMDEIRAVPSTGDAAERAAQAERLRKMLLAMVEDIRVVLIKLAERTQAMRFLVGAGAQRSDAAQRGAREVQDLFAPLANRLGVWQLKWELEDLALRALEPATYKAIAQMLDERRVDRERYIESVIGLLARELAAAGLRADVTGRPKHIFSIWTKMRRKGAGIESLYDIRALRILVDDVKRLLRGARRRPSPVDAAPGRIRRLHREAEIEQLSLAAHGGDRSGGQGARGADPHVRHAPALRIRRRRALALQGGPREGRAPRSRVRGPHRLAAPGARLEGRRRRRVGLAHRVQEQPLHRHDLRADAAGQGRRSAARRDAGRLSPTPCTRISDTAAAALASTARWSRSITC